MLPTLRRELRRSRRTTAGETKRSAAFSSLRARPRHGEHQRGPIRRQCQRAGFQRLLPLPSPLLLDIFVCLLLALQQTCFDDAPSMGIRLVLQVLNVLQLFISDGGFHDLSYLSSLS